MPDLRNIDYSGHVPDELEDNWAASTPEDKPRHRKHPERGLGNIPRWLKVAIIADLAVFLGAVAWGLAGTFH